MPQQFKNIKLTHTIWYVVYEVCMCFSIPLQAYYNTLLIFFLFSTPELRREEKSILFFSTILCCCCCWVFVSRSEFHSSTLYFILHFYFHSYLQIANYSLYTPYSKYIYLHIPKKKELLRCAHVYICMYNVYKRVYIYVFLWEMKKAKKSSKKKYNRKKNEKEKAVASVRIRKLRPKVRSR